MYTIANDADQYTCNACGSYTAHYTDGEHVFCDDCAGAIATGAAEGRHDAHAVELSASQEALWHDTKVQGLEGRGV